MDGKIMTITAQKVDDIDINRIKELIPHRTLCY